MATNEQRELALLKVKVKNITALQIKEIKETKDHPYLDEWKKLTSTEWYGDDVYSEVDPLLKEIDRMDAKTDFQDTLIEWMGGYEVLEEEEEAHLLSLSDSDALSAIFLFVVLSMVDLYR